MNLKDIMKKISKENKNDMALFLSYRTTQIPHVKLLFQLFKKMERSFISEWIQH